MFKNIQPKWYIGIIALLVTIVFFILGAFPLQLHFGMWGFALTQLGILVIALVPVFLFKWKLSDVMPLKKVTLKQLSATLLLLVATFIVVNAVNIITTYLFPEAAEVGAYITEFFATVPLVVAILLVGVLTGICEEALHRGLIQYSFKDNKNELAVMLIMAVIFGVFHLSSYRFLPTAIVGFVLTYVMIKTHNFIIPVIYHAVHNIIAVTIGYFVGAGADQTVAMPLASVGVFLIVAAVTPFLFYAGIWLLNGVKPGKKVTYVALALTVILPAVGIGIQAAAPAPTGMYVTNFTMTHYVNNETEPSIFNHMVIEDEGMFDLFVSISDETNTVVTSVIVEHEDGGVIWEMSGGMFFVNFPTHLRPGTYRVTFTYETESVDMVLVGINFSVRYIG